jgi:hypothetical protein
MERQHIVIEGGQEAAEGRRPGFYNPQQGVLYLPLPHSL